MLTCSEYLTLINLQTDTGPTGPSGPVGLIGGTGLRPTGASGPSGVTGPSGPSGLDGPNSTDSGPTGVSGPTGHSGATGPSGPTGPSGLIGIPLVPTGTIFGYGGTSAPSGWLLCNGDLIRRADYAALFDVIGTSYGVGDNLTTFQLPDLRKKIPIGGTGVIDNYGDVSLNFNLGKSGGEESHSMTISELASHNHSVTDGGHSHNVTLTGFKTDGDNGGSNTYLGEAGGSNSRGYTSGTSQTNISLGATGAGNSYNNTPQYTTMNYIIKT